MIRVIIYCFRSVVGAQRGSIMVELAAVLPVLLTLFFGVVEIASYMRYSEKITRVANDLAEIFATQQSWQDGDEVDEILNNVVGRIVAPEGIGLSVVFCPAQNGGSGSVSFVQNYPAQNTVNYCTPATGQAVTCDPDLVAGNRTLPYVVVSASCQYNGLFSSYLPPQVLQEVRSSSLRYIQRLL